MRWCLFLCLLTAAAAAQPAPPKPNAKRDPFAPLDDKFRSGVAVPGVESRIEESLALLKRAIEKHAADVDSIERAFLLLERLNRLPHLLPVVEKALKTPDLTDNARARLRSVRGQARLEGVGAVPNIVVGPGFNQGALKRLLEQMQKASKPAARLALPDLEAAVKALPNDARAREALARVLRTLDAKAHKERIEKLTLEAIGIRLRRQVHAPKPVDMHEQVVKLRERAEELEQIPDGPKHDDALELRRRALILEFCTHTIAFDPGDLWLDVALLAPEHMVRENLTRTFLTTKGEVSSVPVQYYQAPVEKQVEIVRKLGRDKSANAGAALLAVLRRTQSDTPVTDAARAAARQDAVRAGLPDLLATALFAEDDEFTQYGARLLVALAGDLRLETAAPVLRKALEHDTDLWVPRGVADALGRIGRAEDAAALLKAARDVTRDVFFRREAARALGRIAPDKLAALENVAELEIAIAAARYRAKPNQSDLGRLLAGLDRMHEADDAARYCADLGIREALPAMETFLAERQDHYAARDVRRDHTRLLASLRGR